VDATDGRGERHLEEADWERLALDELSPEARRAARAHIERCEECGRIDRALRELRQEAQTFDPGVPAERRPSAAPRWLAAIAAAVVAVAGVGLYRLSTRRTGVEQVRGVATARPSDLSPHGVQRVRPRALRWSPVTRAIGYRVKLYDARAVPIWTSPTVSGTTLAWPDQVGAAGTYYWQVTALPSGATSEMTDVTIGPDADPR
jgi:hypothetical protein